MFISPPPPHTHTHTHTHTLPAQVSRTKSLRHRPGHQLQSGKRYVCLSSGFSSSVVFRFHAGDLYDLLKTKQLSLTFDPGVTRPGHLFRLA